MIECAFEQKEMVCISPLAATARPSTPPDIRSAATPAHFGYLGTARGLAELNWGQRAEKNPHCQYYYYYYYYYNINECGLGTHFASIFFAISTGSPTAFDGNLSSLTPFNPHDTHTQHNQNEKGASEHTYIYGRYTAGGTHDQVSFCQAEAKSASSCNNGGGFGSGLHLPSQVVPLYMPWTTPRVSQTA